MTIVKSTPTEPGLQVLTALFKHATKSRDYGYEVGDLIKTANRLNMAQPSELRKSELVTACAAELRDHIVFLMSEHSMNEAKYYMTRILKGVRAETLKRFWWAETQSNFGEELAFHYKAQNIAAIVDTYIEHHLYDLQPHDEDAVFRAQMRQVFDEELEVSTELRDETGHDREIYSTKVVEYLRYADPVVDVAVPTVSLTDFIAQAMAEYQSESGRVAIASVYQVFADRAEHLASEDIVRNLRRRRPPFATWATARLCSISEAWVTEHVVKLPRYVQAHPKLASSMFENAVFDALLTHLWSRYRKQFNGRRRRASPITKADKRLILDFITTLITQNTDLVRTRINFGKNGTSTPDSQELICIYREQLDVEARWARL